MKICYFQVVILETLIRKLTLKSNLCKCLSVIEMTLNVNKTEIVILLLPKRQATKNLNFHLNG